MFNRICLGSYLVLELCLLEVLKSHSFNFSTCDTSVHILYFFLIHSAMIVSYDPLYSGFVTCNFSFIVSNFIDLSTLFFFFPPWWVRLKVYQFIFLKEQLLFSFILLLFLHLCLIYFCSDLYDSVISINFGFVCSSFASCFRSKVRFFIWDFSGFLR